MRVAAVKVGRVIEVARSPPSDPGRCCDLGVRLQWWIAGTTMVGMSSVSWMIISRGRSRASVNALFLQVPLRFVSPGWPANLTDDLSTP